MKNITEIVFILDRSGSMSGLEKDTIGGLNSLLEKHKKEEGEAIVTTVLFDNEYDIIHDRTPIKAISPITEKEYFVRGTTALLDAIGNSITKIINAQKALSEDYKPTSTIFVIITDGEENASQEYSYDTIKKLISKQKEDSSWEFLFIGANIDAIETASKFDIDSSHSVNYTADEKGTGTVYDSMSKVLSKVRGVITSQAREAFFEDEEWKEEIENDHNEKR